MLQTALTRTCMWMRVHTRTHREAGVERWSTRFQWWPRRIKKNGKSLKLETPQWFWEGSHCYQVNDMKTTTLQHSKALDTRSPSQWIHMKYSPSREASFLLSRSTQTTTTTFSYTVLYFFQCIVLSKSMVSVAESVTHLFLHGASPLICRLQTCRFSPRVRCLVGWQSL